MNVPRILTALALLAAAPALAAPAIYRCTTSGGAVAYQEIPCPAGAHSRTTDIPAVDYPEVNRVERDRLLARAAALEERLLKRAELESAERIAREQILAREREAQAMREFQAQREPSAAVPVIIVAPMTRPPRPRHLRPHYRF